MLRAAIEWQNLHEGWRSACQHRVGAAGVRGDGLRLLRAARNVRCRVGGAYATASVRRTSGFLRAKLIYIKSIPRFGHAVRALLRCVAGDTAIVCRGRAPMGR
jgi:hypothetical protein